MHTLDPRLAELACERLVDWVQFTRNALYAQHPPPRRTITQPRRARPAGHSNPRLYS